MLPSIVRPPKQLQQSDEVRQISLNNIYITTSRFFYIINRRYRLKLVSYISSRSIRKHKVCASSVKYLDHGVIRRTVKELQRKSSITVWKKRVSEKNFQWFSLYYYLPVLYYRVCVCVCLVPTNILSVLEEFGSSGYRVLALAYKDLPRKINWKSLYHLKLENVKILYWWLEGNWSKKKKKMMFLRLCCNGGGAILFNLLLN